MKNSPSPDHWSQQAIAWAKNIREGMDVFRDLYSLPAFLEFIGNIRDKHILDVGCGEGYNSRFFAKQGARVVAVDLSSEMIKLAQEEEEKTHLGIQYFQASWTDLSIFKDHSFDFVVSTMALMDGPGYEKALKEFHRVLKPQGNLYFSVTHPCFLTPGYSNLKNKNGISTHRLVNNYFKEGPWEFTWQLAKNPDKSDGQTVTSINYHRTLSTYINHLIEAGFTLCKIQEPKPSDAACEKNPRLTFSRDVAPPFIFFHARKP
jgi:ubiquinone/menaquinone biosynthesis C-methylase UbiE